MHFSYAYTPYMWPPAGTVLFLLLLAAYCWRRRSVPGVIPLMIGCLFAAAWAAGSVMEYAALDLATKLAWIKFEAVFQLPLVTAITCFFLEYSWPSRWLTRRNLILLSIPCLLSIISALTNDLHHFTWLGFAYNGKVIQLIGPFAWMLIVYALVGLSTLNLIVFAWVFQRSPQHRWPVVIMLIGQIVGRTAYVLDVARVLQSTLPFTVLGMAFEFLVYAIALFGFRILDPILLARQTVIEQLHTGMLVLDPLGRVASLNPTAQAILEKPEKQLIGRPIKDLLPAWVEMSGKLRADGIGRIEISLPGMPLLAKKPGTSQDDVGRGLETRNYQLEVSTLKDWRGLEAGRLIMLHDVTEEKRAQARLLQEQWAQATLQEREQLAHELHDGISQSLAFLNVQAQAAQLYIQSEQAEAAQASVSRLSEVSFEMQGDVRELIGNLLAVSLPSEGFLATLRQTIAHFEQRNQIPVRLEIADPEAILSNPRRLPASVGVQLVRILQEALANVRKHAGRPKNVAVQLQAEGVQLQLMVSDDGAGFDLHATGATGGHYGLQVMHSRATRIGGQLEVISTPGQGTKVVVKAPVNSKL